VSADLPAALLREGLLLVGTVSAPLLLTLLVVGLFVGVLQAATQINDAAVGFVPRLLAAAVACWLLGGWMVQRLAGFFASAVERMAG
jgi:flagellar biosynthesis protein FliQ